MDVHGFDTEVVKLKLSLHVMCGNQRKHLSMFKQ